jgi:hypothetical protein
VLLLAGLRAVGAWAVVPRQRPRLHPADPDADPDTGCAAHADAHPDTERADSDTTAARRHPAAAALPAQ